MFVQYPRNIANRTSSPERIPLHVSENRVGKPIRVEPSIVGCLHRRGQLWANATSPILPENDSELLNCTWFQLTPVCNYILTTYGVSLKQFMYLKLWLHKRTWHCIGDCWLFCGVLKVRERMNKIPKLRILPLFTENSGKRVRAWSSPLYDAYPIAFPILLQLASLTHDDLSGKSPYELDLSDVSNVHTGRIEVRLIGFLSCALTVFEEWGKYIAM
jgi:hypothetical protein